MFGGLVLNGLYNLVGLAHPFSVRPLTFAIAGVSILAVLIAYARAPRTYRLLPRPKLSLAAAVPLSIAVCIGLYLPSIAVAGALTLNNNGPNSLALLCMGAIAVLFIILVVGHRFLSRYNAWFLYVIGVTILLGTSMRGWNITGHDIMQEYQVFELTLKHAAWHMQYYQDAYMACLSITILPTIFQKLTGLSDPYVFKFVFQIFAALLAPMLYETLRPFAGTLKSLLAAFLFITFPTFLTDIMMLNRQETALLFLTLSVLVGLDSAIPRRLKGLMSFLFLTGMVLSHYSTSYVALGALLVAILLAIVWHTIPLVIRRPREPFIRATYVYHLPVIVAALVVLVAWGSIITQSSTNVYQTIHAISSSVSQPSSIKTIQPKNYTHDPVAHYVAASAKIRATNAGDYYPAKVIATYPVRASAEATLPETSVAHILAVPTATLSNVYTMLRSGYAVLVEVLIVLGLIVAFAVKKLRGTLPVQYLFFGVGTLALIGSQVVLPSGAINYGVTRVIQEALILLALPMILAGLWLLQLCHLPEKLCIAVVATLLVVFYAVLSGFLTTLTGGYKPVLPLSNAGLYYEAYYTHGEEIDAAHWLVADTPVGSRIFSAEFMRRKLITYANIFGQPTLVPAAIPVDSYVVLDYSNTVFNQVPAYDGANVIYYLPPTAFLQANKNIVYTSSHVVIYK